jgi:nucleotide-binding universal stress UspA family protein
MASIRKILLALDGSAQAAKAVDLALAMAKAFGSQLIAIHVISDQPLTDAERRLAESEYQVDVQQTLSGPEFIASPGLAPMSTERLTKTSSEVGLAIRTAIARRIMDHAELASKSEGITAETMLRDGDPASVILAVANEERPDLLIMGSRGLGAIGRLLIGSVSYKVSHSAECTVMLVK